MTFYFVTAIFCLFCLCRFAATDQEFCCQYHNEKHPIDAMACSSYDCAATIKGWGSITHKTSTASCSSCQVSAIPSEPAGPKKNEEKDKKDARTPHTEAANSDVWVQCCLYSTGPDYSDTLAYPQDSSNECAKYRDSKLFIGWWWSTNKDDCFFLQSGPKLEAAVNSTASM